MAYSNYLASQLGGPIIPGLGGAATSSGQPIAGPGLGWHGPTDVYSPGQVLGSQAPTSPAQSTGDGGGGNGLDPHINPATGTWDDNYFAQNQGGGGGDPWNQVRSDIEGGYSSYEAQLDQMLNEGLPGQRTSQEDIARSQWERGVASLGEQKTMGEYDLGRERERVTTQKKKSLKDISSNMRNLFMAGNNYLGSMGAGDSSAANMYAYALTKEGNRRRGDVMSEAAGFQQQISDKSWKLSQIHDSQLRDIESQYENQVSSIASWFAEQQNAIRLNKGQLALSKGQDLAALSSQKLNVALAALDQARVEQVNRHSALDSWAMSNASNLQQLRANMAGVSEYKAGNITNQPMSGNIQTGNGLFQNPAWYPGTNYEEEKRA